VADYTLAAGDHGAYTHQLAPAVVDTVTFAAHLDRVEITSDGTAALYVTVDSTTPTIAGAGTWELPAGVRAVRAIDVAATGVTVVKLISAGTPVYSVAQPADTVPAPELVLAADEETRAREFRAALARRAAYARTVQQRLAGSQSARAALTAAWQPVIDAARERAEDDFLV
jgi:hypothetical protein